jgi:hypothetical protein
MIQSRLLPGLYRSVRGRFVLKKEVSSPTGQDLPAPVTCLCMFIGLYWDNRLKIWLLSLEEYLTGNLGAN